jgi:flagellar basal-body rod modification protein FlgD
MKSQEFTTQLVQFSTVEQAIATNEKLDRMLQSQAANRATQAVSFIGKDVAMEGNQIALDGGEADFAYTLEGDAESALVEITDSAGQVVRTIDGATDAGRHEVAWNGETNNGTALPDGTYNVQVRAVDADNNTVKATTESRGRVSGFELRDDSIFLQVGDVEVPFDQVTAVYNDSGSGGSLPDPDA